jgi:hypothetical protein
VAARLMFVDRIGNRVPIATKDAATGHMAIVNAFLFVGNPAIGNLRPCVGAEDLPPDSVMSSRWIEAHHAQKQLAAETHEAAGGEMTPAAFLAAHAKL